MKNLARHGKNEPRPMDLDHGKDYFINPKLKEKNNE